MKNSTDIIIHINESLDTQRRKEFSTDVGKIQGVISADLKEKRRHLMIVSFNPLKTKAVDILNNIKKKGTAAQLVAWL